MNIGENSQLGMHGFSSLHNCLDSLLAKVGGAVIGDFQKWSVSSYVYETIYGHKKVCHKKVCLEQNILLVPLYGIRSFHAPFHHFS